MPFDVLSTDFLIIFKKITNSEMPLICGMTRLANQHDVLKLAQGFPDFDPLEELLTALERAAHGQFH
jgi:hypothetical protein